MKYFLKRTQLKKGEYLQIYSSEYIRGIGSRNHSYKALGYVDELKAKGIKDPVAKAQAEVKKLNDALRKDETELKVQKIGSTKPMKNAGYFLLKGVAAKLTTFRSAVETISSVREFRYDVYQLMMALVYARAVMPASKRRTYLDVLPMLFDDLDKESYAQVLSCCEYIGSEYQKIVCFLTRSLEEAYGLDFSSTYFDCTNFYFEIDMEDEFRRKGPSKENRNDPIVGMGLMLDANQIPVAMSLYSGNASEQPQLRNTIDSLRKQNSIKGRTIQIADKGLNSSRNIYEALKNGDGYLFSRSLKKQSKKEREWFFTLDPETWDRVYEEDEDGNKVVKYSYYAFTDSFEYKTENEFGEPFSFRTKEKRVITFSPKLRRKKLTELNKMVEKAQNLCLSRAKRSEFGECAKYISFMGKDGEEEAVAFLNMEAIETEKRFAGFNMLVTSEVKQSARAIYSTYHNLWRIEQSFRILKSYLEARPVYLSSINSIKGHFLICYIGIVLERVLEFTVLGNSFSHERIMKFIRDFTVVRTKAKDYMNMLTTEDEVGAFLSSTLFPEVQHFILSPADITKLMKTKLSAKSFINC